MNKNVESQIVLPKQTEFPMSCRFPYSYKFYVAIIFLIFFNTAEASPAIQQTDISNTEVANRSTVSNTGYILINDHPMLESKKPNSIGYTWENNSLGFLDANISIQYPLFYDQFKGGCLKKPWGYFVQPYFSYTGRFGQYINNVYSSPVVTKTFNPEISLRVFSNIEDSSETLESICEAEKNLAHHAIYKTSRINYFDIQYGHLSNGQAIDNHHR